MLFLLPFILTTITTPQQMLPGMAYSVPIADTNLQTGTLICVAQENYSPCTQSSTKFFGVVDNQPAINLSDKNNTNSIPIITTGETTMMVTSQSAPIVSGDYLSISTKAGIAHKASDSEHPIAQAKENYSAAIDGPIRVTLNPALAIDVTTKQLQQAQTQTNTDNSPLTFGSIQTTKTRLTPSITIALGTLISTLILYFKTAKTSLEALGRNPLASRSINLGLITTNLFILSFFAAGMYISYLILTRI